MASKFDNLTKVRTDRHEGRLDAYELPGKPEPPEESSEAQHVLWCSFPENLPERALSSIDTPAMHELKRWYEVYDRLTSQLQADPTNVSLMPASTKARQALTKLAECSGWTLQARASVRIPAALKP